MQTNKGKLIPIILLTLFCTNISEANYGVSQRAVSLLPVSLSSTYSDSHDSGANFILDFVPGGFLYSPDMDGFSVSKSGGGYYETQIIDGYESWMPSLRAGLRINSPVASFDFTGGGGYLLNSAISGPFTLGDFAVNFNVGKNFSIGPHIGIISFGDLDWFDFDSDYFNEPDIEFSGSSGLMGGLAMTMGGSKSRFYLSFDYIEAELDVKTDSGWVANRQMLDLTGFGLQLGLFLRF